MKNKNIVDRVLRILDSKQAKYAGALILLGISYHIGQSFEKAMMEREYQLLDEQRIKENYDRIDNLRNQIYDLRDENIEMKQKISMYELQLKQKDGNKE